MIGNISIDLSIILLLTILADLVDGEVRDRVCPVHPVKVCWQVGTYLLKKLKKSITGGVMLWTLTVLPVLAIYSIPLTLCLVLTRSWVMVILCIIISSIVNKFTISLKLLDWYYRTILECFKNNDEAKARVLLQEIVRRDVFSLDRPHLYSALIETYVESLVDGFTSPLFWFSILGLPGSYLQRLSNTMDSLVGYRHEPYRDVGWFSANVDTFLNVPGSIIFAIIILLSSYRKGIFGEFINILKESRSVSSINARVVFAAISATLRVDLEKLDEYRVGNYSRLPDLDDCIKVREVMYRVLALCVAMFLIITMFVNVIALVA